MPCEQRQEVVEVHGVLAVVVEGERDEEVEKEVRAVDEEMMTKKMMMRGTMMIRLHLEVGDESEREETLPPVVPEEKALEGEGVE